MFGGAWSLIFLVGGKIIAINKAAGRAALLGNWQCLCSEILCGIRPANPGAFQVLHSTLRILADLNVTVGGIYT